MSNVQSNIDITATNRTQKAFKQVEASAKGLASQFSVFKGFDLGAMLGLGGTLTKIYAISTAFSQTIKAADKLKGIQAAFEAITGSTQAAEAQLKKVREQANLLGTDYIQLADLTKSWLASSKGTAIEKQQDEILQGFLSYSAVLNLPQEQIERIIVAMSQMASKGKIMSEELRSQMGEALPGAFNLLAKSMNVSTEELNKMLEDGKVGLENLVLLAKDLQKEYGDKVVENAGKVSNNLARVKNIAVDIGQNISEATNTYEIFNGLLEKSIELLGYISEGTKGLANFSVNFGQFWNENLSFVKFAKMNREDSARSADYFRSLPGQLDAINAKIELLEKKKNRTKALGFFNFDPEEYEKELKELIAERDRIEAKMDAAYESGVKYQLSALPQPETKQVQQKSAAELKKEQKAREKSIADLARLNEEIAKLTMTEEEYREFDLTNKIADLTKQLPFATSEIEKFAEAQRAAWAKEDEKKKLDEQKELLDTQADFYEELAKKTGQYSKSLEFQNKLIDEQVKLWQTAQIPQEYIDKMEGILRLETSENPLDGLMLGIQESFAEYGNLATQIKDVYKSAFSEMSDALTEWASGADVSFSEVAKSFTNMLLEMSIRYTMSNLASGVFGSSLFGGIGSFFGFGGNAISSASALTSFIPTFHTGGMADSPKNYRPVDPDVFANAPRYHGGYNPGFEQPAILLKNERVLNPAETYAYNMGLAGAGYTEKSPITIHQEINITFAENNADMSLSEADMQKLQQQMQQGIEMSVMNVLVKQKRAGGMLR